MLFDPQNEQALALLRLALAEDIGTGDVTSKACVPKGRMASGEFRAKQDLVLAGVELLPVLYRMQGGDGKAEVTIEAASGSAISKGTRIAAVRGEAQLLLEIERTALNLLQRLSGIATMARQYAAQVAHTKCRVLDTRKTTPGLRYLEKAAAAAGGVTNHRQGLFDAILIKNNHIDAAGGVGPALRAALATGLAVEIEVRDRAELDEALANGASHVMLDNLTPDQARAEIAYIAGRATVELSGGVTLESVGAYAETGADFVSCGAITHSAVAVDINFRLAWQQ